MLKILFHIDKPQRWKLVLENAANSLYEGKITGEKIQIEVVANSAAVLQLSQKNADQEDLSAQIIALAENTVVFAACRNAMENHRVFPQDLFPCVKIVPAGVVEIAQRQTDGYAYIKP
ncbi:MAG: DsrE family protein [Christensenella sp.]|nr:DsrE family protein [Christensenella sp.]